MKFKCFGISPYHSNCMKSDNPHSGIYEAQTSRCLDLNGGNPSCNQGGVVVLQLKKGVLFDGYNLEVTGQISKTLTCQRVDVANIPILFEGNSSSERRGVLAAIEGNGSRPSHKGSGINDGKKMYTLNSTEVHGVIYERKAEKNGEIHD